jgi:hypothetical protein
MAGEDSGRTDGFDPTSYRRTFVAGRSWQDGRCGRRQDGGLTHLQPSPNNDYSHYVALVKKSFSGEVHVAHDLAEF